MSLSLNADIKNEFEKFGTEPGISLGEFYIIYIYSHINGEIPDNVSIELPESESDIALKSDLFIHSIKVLACLNLSKDWKEFKRMYSKMVKKK